MADDENICFLQRSRNSFKKFSDNLKLCGNIKREAKEEIEKAVKELMVIIDDQILAIKGLKDKVINQLEAQIQQQIDSNKQITERLDRIESNSNQNSFAAVVTGSGPQRQQQNSRKVDKNVLIIRPKNGAQTSKQTVNAFKNVITKKQKQMAIKELSNGTKGSVVVKCRTEQDLKDIKHLTQLDCKDVEVIEPKRKNPLIRIFGVDSDIKKEEIIECLRQENNDLKKYFEVNDKEDINSHIKVRTIIRNRIKGNGSQRPIASTDQTNDFILELSPKVHKVLRNFRSILIDMRSYRFADFISITRCFKCQRFGHLAINCREIDNICGLCTRNHETKQCSDSNKKCINCHRFNQSKYATQKVSTDHSVFDKCCDRLNKMRQKVISNTNYE
jgi:ribosomal protein S17E